MQKPTRAKRRKRTGDKVFQQNIGIWKADTVTNLADQERIVPEGSGEPSNQVHLIPEPRGLGNKGLDAGRRGGRR